MYFWKIEQLKNDIKNNRLSEQDRFIYAFISIVVSAIGMEVVALIPAENGNLWDAIRSAGNILIVTIGTLFAYRANGGNSGSDFLGRYFSIGFVMAIRFLVLLILLSLVFFASYFSSFAAGEAVSSSAFDVLPYLLWYTALYWRVCQHIAAVKNP